MSDVDSRGGIYRFSYKSTWDHIKGVLSSPVELLLVTVGAFGSFWLVIETVNYFLNVDLRGWKTYSAIAFASVLIGLGERIVHYLLSYPEGFAKATARAKWLAQVQPTKWEFKLAQVLLAERIGPLDRELDDLNSRRAFVPGSKPRDFIEYFRWMESRVPNLERMLDVAKALMLDELPRALTSTEEKPASPMTILACVEGIERLYRDTITFERSSKSIIPPDRCAKLHELQLGWTEPIRDGIRQLFVFLQQVNELDPSADSSLQFSITFKDVPGIEEFSSEMDRLTPFLPELMGGI